MQIKIKDPVSNKNVWVHVNSSTEISDGIYYDVDYTARTAAEVDCRFAVIYYYDDSMVCQDDWQGELIDIDEIADARWIDCTPTNEQSELSITEAAETLGISRQAVHSLIKRGKLEARKVGNAWMIDGASVANRARR